jgi:hypothetical protein
MSYQRRGCSVWPTSRAYRERVGLVRRFQVTPYTNALWQFDGNLLDSGPYGIHFSASDDHYVYLMPGLRALRLGDDIAYGAGNVSIAYNAALTPYLALLGDVTVDLLLWRESFSGYTDPYPIIAFGDVESSYSMKCPWLLCSNSYGTAFGHGHEASSHNSAKALLVNTVIDRGGMMCIKCTRNATDKSLQIYTNGRKLGDGYYTSDPDKNEKQSFFLGSSTDPLMSVCSLRIESVHHSEEQARADYLWTLGQYYGEDI